MDAAIIGLIAKDVALPEESVGATVVLIEKGSTVPFIAHYRKEVTGGMHEANVRSIQERLTYYREALDRRAALLKALTEEGRLTDELRLRIESCFSKVELEDLHHQFRPKKKSRAAEAIEKGLEPLADYFWNQEPDAWSLEEHVDVFIDPAKKIESREQALQGAVNIIAELIAGNFEYRATLREMLWKEGCVNSTVVPAKAAQKTKYNMYYNRREPVTSIPSHRVLAIRRGSKEGILTSSIEGDASKALEYLNSSIIRDRNSIFAPILEAAIRESYNHILRPLIETEVRAQLKERADRDAIRVFQENLANLLLSPPAGPMVVMGLDTSKTGDSRLAVIDEKGAFLEEASICFGQSKTVPEAKLTESPTNAAKPLSDASSELKEQASDEAAIETPKADAGSVVPISLDMPSEPSAEPIPMAEEVAEIAAPDAEAIACESAAEPNIPAPGVEESSAPLLPEFELEASAALETPAESSIIQPAAMEVDTGSAIESAQQSLPAFIQATSESQETAAVSPLEGTPKSASETLRHVIDKYNVRAIALGIGARDMEAALRQILAEEKMDSIMIASVNDAGIAIYSSSRVAREEFPNLNATARCAISLARRLQDPLSELVKIDPKLIGVGQYQHDVDQKELHRGLLHTVQSCVSNVGIDLNSANQSLLRYVVGLNDKSARKILAHRNAKGPFSTRAALLSVLGIDRNTYDQAAGFLRIRDGENPLDRTRVHPESYPIVEKMAANLGVEVGNLIGNKDLIKTLKLDDYAHDAPGLPTLVDICEELRKPGADPRKPFALPKHRSDINEMVDLKDGMVLEGTITNVTNFGAFVDIGIHQDGLVHLSQMSNRFIRDPREAVKVGDVVQVKVISVEVETKRIGLSMKALLPQISRRRKKPQRKAKPQVAASVPGREPLEAASSNPALTPTPPPNQPPRDSHRSASQKPRRDGGASRPRRRNDRRRERSPQAASTVSKPPQREVEQVEPRQPERSLQEKIAILQSKFRGIS